MFFRNTLMIGTFALFGLFAMPEAADAQARGNQGKGGGPPFCQNGRGHPVHGWEWCARKGYDTRGNVDRGRNEDRRRDDRIDVGRNGSYERNHEEFHRQLDRKYSELSARRTRDIAYQVELRRQKQQEHDEWHRRNGTTH
jgi:hypothetical protein